MNILMVLSQLEVTGAEVYAVTLADQLIKNGNRVLIASDTLTKKTEAEYIKIEFNKRSLIKRYQHIKKIIEIIKEKDIQVVHAHSRASSWPANIACKICKIPLITTVHGRQPVHLSRKIIKGFGDKVIAVCENIENHLEKELGVKDISVLRNPIDLEKYSYIDYNEDFLKESKPIISIIGRLSGPKGEVAYNVLKELSKREDIILQMVGGKEIPEKFNIFKEKVNFLGYVDNVSELMESSKVIIGAGRVAVEGALKGRAVIAVGEAELIGTVKKENIHLALNSNFGDIGFEKYEYSKINEMLDEALKIEKFELKEVMEKIQIQFDKNKIVKEIEDIYNEVYVQKKQYEMPVIMYHRVIKDNSSEKEKGIHGIYVTESMFEEHLKTILKKGYTPVTFKDLLNNEYKKRFDKSFKPIVLTFDDGYEDNYKVAFPILKRYVCKAVIYIMGELTYNRWDVEVEKNPEEKFNMITDEMIKEMQESNLIEFGVHTLTHPRLSKLHLQEVKYEILESKNRIEKKLGEKALTFAYPYGDFNSDVKKIAREAGFQFVVATDSGPLVFSKDLMEIRRIGIFSTNNLFNFKRKISGKYNFIRMKRELKKNKNI
ncbi:MAG: polysaccharide deacetylase family protein [Fusobacteriaceae bacterium]